MRQLQLQCELPAPADQVWRWYESLYAFERLSPPWEPVEALNRNDAEAFQDWLAAPTDTHPLRATDPVEEGKLLLFRVPLLSIGPIQFPWMTWEALHEHVDPPRGFQDFQLRGPFQMWEHRHSFTPVLTQDNWSSHATLEDNHFRFKLPFGSLGETMGEAFAFQKIYRLFRYRFRVLQDDLKRKPDQTPEGTIWLDASLPAWLCQPLGWYLNTQGYRVLMGAWIPDDFCGFSDAQKATLGLHTVIFGDTPSRSLQHHIHDESLYRLQIREGAIAFAVDEEDDLTPMEQELNDLAGDETAQQPDCVLLTGAVVANRGELPLVKRTRRLLQELGPHPSNQIRFRWLGLDDLFDVVIRAVVLKARRANPVPVAHPDAVDLRTIVSTSAVIESWLQGVPLPMNGLKRLMGLTCFTPQNVTQAPEGTPPLLSLGNDFGQPFSARFLNFQDAWTHYYGL
jgi:ligand-binding SRPBCC domain-containing protein